MNINQKNNVKYILLSGLLSVLLAGTGWSQASYNPNAKYKIYKVQADETLAEIAQRFLITPQLIRRFNNMTPNEKIYVGRELKIPERYNVDEKKVVYLKKVNQNTLLHTVRPNETLNDISQMYNVNLYELMSINNIQENQRLRARQKLLIPNPNPRPAAKIVNQPNHFNYIVKKGDNLLQIAKRFGTSVSDISYINNISTPYIIYIGQKLKIPSQASNSIATQNGNVIDADRINNVQLASRDSYRRTAPRNNNAVPKQPGKLRYISHRVKANDTMMSIAARYGVSPRSIRLYNRLNQNQILSVGQILRIPVR